MHLFQRIAVLQDGMEYDGCDCLSAAPYFGCGPIEVETGWLLYSLVRRIKPKTIVQTGTHLGYSSAWMAIALAETHRDYPHLSGHLWSWDCGDYDKKPLSLMTHLGVQEYTTFITADSKTGDVPEECTPIDFLFLDADHAAESVVAEFERFGPYLSPGALIGFHDTRLDPREAEGVRLIQEQTGWQGIFLRNLRGIDFLQKPL